MLTHRYAMTHLITFSALIISAIAGAVAGQPAPLAIVPQPAAPSLVQPVVATLKGIDFLLFINPSAIALALFLALVNNRIIEYFVSPLFDHFHWPRKGLLYVAALTGFVLAMLAQADLFTANVFVSPVVDEIVTAIIIAGGANLIHDVTDRSVKIETP